MSFSIPEIKSFQSVFEPGAFAPIPDDWWIALADIEKSTSRVIDGGEEGWKTVNFVAAACIAAVENACAPAQPITLFTGDGALIAGPPEVRDSATTALSRVVGWASHAHSLDLRAGVVDATFMVAGGRRLEVACETRERCTLYHARGGVAEALDRRLKAEPDLRVLPSSDLPDLTGLACGFDPVLPGADTFVAVIVQPEPGLDPDSVLARADAIIGEIAPGDAVINPDRLSVSILQLPRRLAREVSSIPGLWGWPQVLGRALGFLIWSKLGLTVRRSDGSSLNYRTYLSEVSLACDAQRVFDGARYLLDVSKAQIAAISSRLGELEAAGEIRFGISEHQYARLTCQVSADASRHAHFIDGSDGGFWLAAQALKAKTEPTAA